MGKWMFYRSINPPRDEAGKVGVGDLAHAVRRAEFIDNIPKTVRNPSIHRLVPGSTSYDMGCYQEWTMGAVNSGVRVAPRQQITMDHKVPKEAKVRDREQPYCNLDMEGQPRRRIGIERCRGCQIITPEAPSIP